LSTKVIPKNRITAHFPGKQVELHITIKKIIVKDIIGKMLFESRENDAEIKEKTKALLLFEDIEEAPDILCIKIKNSFPFSLIVDYLNVGLSFRAEACVILGLIPLAAYLSAKWLQLHGWFVLMVWNAIQIFGLFP
jgi:hypothetical protein